jgi:hypothetical protein
MYVFPQVEAEPPEMGLHTRRPSSTAEFEQFQTVYKIAARRDLKRTAYDFQAAPTSPPIAADDDSETAVAVDVVEVAANSCTAATTTTEPKRMHRLPPTSPRAPVGRRAFNLQTNPWSKQRMKIFPYANTRQLGHYVDEILGRAVSPPPSVREPPLAMPENAPEPSASRPRARIGRLSFSDKPPIPEAVINPHEGGMT